MTSSSAEMVKPAFWPDVPGDTVSVDQLISQTPGLIAQMSGILTTQRYTCVTVFVDHYSNLGYVHLQKTTSVEHTLEAKAAFERYAKQHGVSMRHYHADNGTFAARPWMQSCHQSGQRLSFAGVNAHHQNGKAESRIKHIQDMARTMMIYANKRWPEAITTNLWPYAIWMANDSINATPWIKNDGKLPPIQVFAKTAVSENPKHWYHFGCPVYVLDSHLQQGRRPPGGKWEERARIGAYLGRSPQHSRHVALVLNIKTARVSPQFHVKMDTIFHSVKHSTRQDCTVPRWMDVAGFTNQDRPPDGPRKRQRIEAPRELDETGNIPPVGDIDPSVPPEETTAPAATAPAATVQHPQLETAPAPEDARPAQAATTQPPAGKSPAPEAAAPFGTTRLGWKRKLPNKFQDMVMETAIKASHNELFAFQAEATDTMQDTVMAYKASTDPDIMYMHQAMHEPDTEQFKIAMRKGINSQIEGGALQLVKTDDVPKGATLLPAVWQMRRKRHIKTREVYKWKARLNLDGSHMIHKRDYDQTYAPVASWSTICLLLTMSAIHDWHTVQLDYVPAFTQAPVERELYMKLPKGFEVKGAKPNEYAFRVTKNTYGQKQAGRVWNQYLVKQLRSVGFIQSDVDECVFYKGEMIYVLYTDDSILAGPDRSEIDKTIKQMQKILDLTIEGDLNDFLGVNINRAADGAIHLTQPHLIDQVLDDLRLTPGKSKAKDTPMQLSKILFRQADAEAFDKSFDYRSVIGKLNYLEKGSRPNIAYAAHQCARFAADPRKPHGDAVRWLGRYLLGTRDKGMILRPDPN